LKVKHLLLTAALLLATAVFAIEDVADFENGNAVTPAENEGTTTPEPTVNENENVKVVDENEIGIDYRTHGKEWPSKHCIAGGLQSPINIEMDQATPSNKLHFEIIEYHDIRNASLTVQHNRTLIQIDNPNETPGDLNVTNELGESQIYHLEKMLWKIPSEHTLENRQMAAELQIFHQQYATNKKVTLSFLFDTELVAQESDPRRLKTCFVDSFEFSSFKALTDAGRKPDVIEIPLREFIEFVPQEEVFYYYGSHTQPNCQETVAWFVNTHAHVITPEQVKEMKALLNEELAPQGNYRNI